MKKNHLREIDGEKIRCQYFTWPILTLLFSMLYVPYCFFVFSLSMGEFNLSTWFSGLLISVSVCLIFAIPFIILSVLNRRFFGKIICVINKNGIHYKDGLLRWDEIVKIEYEIMWPEGISMSNVLCHSVVHTKKQNVILFHTPIFFISKVKKYQPTLDAKISKNSKWMIGFMIVLFVITVPIIPIFI